MNLTIVIGGAVIILAIIAHRLSFKFGIPALLLFLLMGMVFGSDGIFGIAFNNFDLAEKLSSSALIIIMFYGGFGTNWKTARPIAAQGILLSVLGTVMTAALTGWFCVAVLKMKLLEGLLVASVISSTDAASVFAILRSKSLNLKGGLAPLLELESGSNDPTSYTLTMIILTLMTAPEAFSVLSFVYLVFAQFAYGLAIGFAIAFLARLVLKYINFIESGFQTLFVFAAALLSYGLANLIGGNGYLAVYVTGIVLGNSRIPHKVTIVHFFDSITWIMQIMLFFILGLLSNPSQIPAILGVAVAIALFMTFVSRPIATVLIMSGFKTPIKEQVIIGWAGLRGAASIVFAIIASVTLNDMSTDIFHIVFCVALLSVGFQGTLLPVFSRKLKLVDDSQSVLRTFNDYQDPNTVRLMNMYINEGHQWIGKMLKDVSLPENSLIVLIKRGSEMIRPNGSSVIQGGDVLVLNSVGYDTNADLLLREESIGRWHKWANKQIKDIRISDNNLVVMIIRKDQNIIPNGNTLIKSGDRLVISNL